VKHALEDAVMCLLGRRRNRKQRRDLLAPEVKPLVERTAPRAAREMKLRLAHLTRASEPERQPRDQRFSRLAAASGTAQQLVSALGQHPLERPLDATRSDPEALGDLEPPSPVAVEHDDLALTLR
jgi:hypothetical protein